MLPISLLIFLLSFAGFAFTDSPQELQSEGPAPRAIPAAAFPPPFDTVPWIQDRTSFCVCFQDPLLELIGFNNSCIDFPESYTWLWENAYQFFFDSCLGACPCGFISVDECFDVYNCEPLSCENATRSFYTGTNATLGVGACSAGMETCLNGTAVVTVPEVTPQPEVCADQLLDADCNGFPGCTDMACFLEAVCLNSTVEQCFDQLTPPCNASFCDGLFRECYTGPNNTLGVGACTFGTETCSNGTASACIGEITPQSESCFAFEDLDCDGDPTNGFPTLGDGCSNGLLGVCAASGNITCNAFGNATECDAPLIAPVAEVCSDQLLDADCDGLAGCADPDCQFDSFCVAECFNTSCTSSALCANISRPCYSGPNGTEGVGNCAAGTEFCYAVGNYSGCVGEILPQPEICDGLDNDCDGVVDNGFDLTSDPNNCGSCGNVCAVSQICSSSTCVGGTAAIVNKVVVGQNLTAMTLTFQIDAVFNIPPGSNATIFDYDFGWMALYQYDSNAGLLEPFFVPVSVTATGNCTANPAWGDINSYSEFEYNNYYYTPLARRPANLSVPLAFVDPGVEGGSCTIIINARYPTGDAFTGDLYSPYNDDRPISCIPNFEGSTDEINVARFFIDGAQVASSQTNYTRCPLDVVASVTLEPLPGPTFFARLVFEMVYFELVNAVALMVDYSNEIPEISSCSTTVSGGPYCVAEKDFLIVDVKGIRLNRLYGSGVVCRVERQCMFATNPPDDLFNVTLRTRIIAPATGPDGFSFGQEFDVMDPQYIYRENTPTNIFDLDSTSIIFTVGPHCDDDLQNQDETDVDCGGSVCVPCALTESCSVDADCLSRSCVGSVCV